ncbi:hypothetical protein BDV28DRAFT_129889 [Aspergillus coremiiformis]|uniref:Ketoreductase domain-containing protein n=1 Tax=Aspergillus coremiiformis TaxID=138285 RepID=A0A5N6ZBD7_9EURO|nr:hypothetical protein BDV28DRAFT_129889 [Aspergillus coremiiformis]
MHHNDAFDAQTRSAIAINDYRRSSTRRSKNSLNQDSHPAKKQTTMPPSLTRHKTVYPAIAATAPALSQMGRTVLITGGSKGIGFAIARAFATAGAARVILVARPSVELSTAEDRIKQAVPSFPGQVVAVPCDLGQVEQVDRLWDDLQAQGIQVDILVLNAAFSGAAGPMLQPDWQQTWTLFEMNLRANLICATRFMRSVRSAAPSSRAILNVSSCFVHDSSDTIGFGAYASTKTAMASLMHHLANETPREQVQIVSFHPGFVYTEGLQEVCGPEDYDWDSGTAFLFFCVGFSWLTACSGFTRELRRLGCVAPGQIPARTIRLGQLGRGRHGLHARHAGGCRLLEAGG